MAYSPSNPPGAYDSAWLRQEFQKIREAMFSPVPFEYLEKQHVAPAKPRDGMIVLADGSDWNPGFGAGYYGYVDGAWVPTNGARRASFKNKLINGEVTRINQRGFSGVWSSLADGAYGYDRWKKSGTNIQQIVEAGSFRTSTLHTLSGVNVTTQQLASPASGNWTITVPNTATFVQLEEGGVATPFDTRPMAMELQLCQRYYEVGEANIIGYAAAGGFIGSQIEFKVTKRAVPTVAGGLPTENTNLTSTTFSPITTGGFRHFGTVAATGNAYITRPYTASAEL